MAEYATLTEEHKTFGTNGYVEISRKRLVEQGEETHFLLVTRGFVAPDGSRRWTRFVTIPDDPETRAWLADALRRV